jgi:hypothetical protein
MRMPCGYFWIVAVRHAAGGAWIEAGIDMEPVNVMVVDHVEMPSDN